MHYSKLLDFKNLSEVKINEVVKGFVDECLNNVQFPFSEELNEFKKYYFELLERDFFKKLLMRFLNKTIQNNL